MLSMTLGDTGDGPIVEKGICLLPQHGGICKTVCPYVTHTDIGELGSVIKVGAGQGRYV